MQKNVCAVAAQRPTGPAGPSLSEVLGSAAALPEAQPAKKGGWNYGLLHHLHSGESFGPLGTVMKNSRTFGDALAYVSEHNYAHSLDRKSVV